MNVEVDSRNPEVGESVKTRKYMYFHMAQALSGHRCYQHCLVKIRRTVDRSVLQPPWTQCTILCSTVHTGRKVGVGGKLEVSFWQDGGNDTQEEGGCRVRQAGKRWTGR